MRRILAWLAPVSVLVFLAVLTHTNLPGAPNSAFFGWGTASPNNSTCTNGLNDGAFYIETDAGSIWVCRTDGDWYDIVSGATGSGSILCVSSAMSATAATCTPSGAIAANTRVDFITDTDSDAGGYTLDVGSGAVDVIYYGGDDVGEDDFGANMVQELWYDGADFIILTARGVGPGKLTFLDDSSGCAAAPAAANYTRICTDGGNVYTRINGGMSVQIGGLHASTHEDGGADELLAEDLATACADGEAPIGQGGGALACETPSGGSDLTNPATEPFHDTFCGGNSANGTIGDLGWFRYGNSVAPTISSATAVAGHPCLRSVVFTATDTHSGILLGDNGSGSQQFAGLNAATFVGVWKFSTPTATTNLTFLWVGFGNFTGEAIGVVYEPATSANWLLRTVQGSGSGTTNVDTGVAFATNTWFTVTIDALAAGTVGATVNAGSRVTTTSNLPSAAVALVGLAAGTNGTSLTALIDSVAFEQSGL